MGWMDGWMETFVANFLANHSILERSFGGASLNKGRSERKKYNFQHVFTSIVVHRCCKNFLAIR